MSCWNKMYPGAMVLMVGLLPLASAQVHAQTSTTTSLLSASIVTLPSASMNKDTDSNNEMLADFLLPDSDLLGTQEVTTLSHAGSNSGWVIGGALGAAAGVAGLASSGGSSASTLLRTPASLPGTGALTGGNVITTTGGTTSGFNGGGTTSGVAGGGFIPGGPGGVSSSAVTPEPGSLALLGGMGLMLTAVKLRRRKR